MAKKYQLTINEHMTAEYPVVSKMLETLSGKERAKTLMATSEAFAKINHLMSNDPEVLYYYAMAILKGFAPDHELNSNLQRVSPDAVAKSPDTSGNDSNNNYLNQIDQMISQL